MYIFIFPILVYSEFLQIKDLGLSIAQENFHLHFFDYFLPSFFLVLH